MITLPSIQKRMVSLFAGVILSTAVQAADGALANESTLTIKPLEAVPLTFHGMANYDHAGVGGMHMVYPAPNAVGLIAAVITHGLLSNSARNRQKEEIQAEADKVLVPYKTVLNTFNGRDLTQRSIAGSSASLHASLLEGPPDLNAMTLIEYQPEFTLTPDQASIVLDSSITIFKGALTYHGKIRIISPPQNTPDPASFWTGNEGEPLKNESARLVAESWRIALRDALSSLGGSPPTYKTVRYRLGSTEQIERAQVLENDCGRLLIRTLRGEILSAPASKPEEANPSGCSAVPHYAQLM